MAEVFPVVHVNNEEQAVEQAGLAFEAGADGVYLIDHQSESFAPLAQAFNTVDKAHPGRFIGLNLLQERSAMGALFRIQKYVTERRMSRLPNGLWVDDAAPMHRLLAEARQHSEPWSKISYLGGVAFKYTSYYTDNPEHAANEALRLKGYVDVVTTSGRGTGHAPSPEKIRAMKEVIGEQKLAVASGISAENIANYQGLFDQLLVSSSIEETPGSGTFAPEKLRDIIELAHSL